MIFIFFIFSRITTLQCYPNFQKVAKVICVFEGSKNIFLNLFFQKWVAKSLNRGNLANDFFVFAIYPFKLEFTEEKSILAVFSDFFSVFFHFFENKGLRKKSFARFPRFKAWRIRI